MKSDMTEDNAENGVQTVSSFESDIQHSFFYTDSKFFASLDTKEIMAAVSQHYPMLSQEQPDTVIKKQIVAFLNDEEFVEKIMDFYNITVYDIFKIMFAQYG